MLFHSVHGTLKPFQLWNNQGQHPDYDADQLVGKDVSVESLELKPRGPNVGYSVIPYEMLRTANAHPQIEISIDGMEAICTGNCDYVYEEATGLITDFSVNGLDVTIQGQNLPDKSLITDLSLAYTDCEITSSDSSTIECTLVNPWVAGRWLPSVRVKEGIIPVDASV